MCWEAGAFPEIRYSSGALVVAVPNCRANPSPTDILRSETFAYSNRRFIADNRMRRMCRFANRTFCRIRWNTFRCGVHSSNISGAAAGRWL
jgi:hypothetical protein